MQKSDSTLCKLGIKFKTNINAKTSGFNWIPVGPDYSFGWRGSRKGAEVISHANTVVLKEVRCL